MASCQKLDSCGHHKGSRYFTGLISPLQKDCQSRFTYTGSGQIIPAKEDDKNAAKTIEALGLNCKRLKLRRESIIKTLENSGGDYLSQSLAHCQDWHGGFYTVIEYVLRKQPRPCPM